MFSSLRSSMHLGDSTRRFMNRELKDPTGVGKIHKGDMYDELKFHKFG